MLLLPAAPPATGTRSLHFMTEFDHHWPFSIFQTGDPSNETTTSSNPYPLAHRCNRPQVPTEPAFFTAPGKRHTKTQNVNPSTLSTLSSTTSTRGGRARRTVRAVRQTRGGGAVHVVLPTPLLLQTSVLQAALWGRRAQLCSAASRGGEGERGGRACPRPDCGQGSWGRRRRRGWSGSSRSTNGRGK